MLKKGFLTFAVICSVFPLAGALQVSLETGNKIPVCFPGQKNKPVLQITADAPHDEEVQIRVTDVDGKSLMNRKQRLTLKKAETAAVELPVPERFGVCRVELFSKSLAGGCGRYAYAFFQPAGNGKINKKGFLFGIQAFALRTMRKNPVKADKMRYAAALCGAKVLREPADWASLQPRKEKKVDFTLLDREIRLCNEAGLRVALLLNNGPAWAAVKGYTPFDKRRVHAWNKAPDPVLWTAFAAEAARRYSLDQICSLELFNEPDLTEFFNGTAAQYLAVTRAAAAEIRKINPDMPILSGGFSDSWDMSGKGGEEKFLEKVLAGGQGDFDILAIHMHGKFSGYLQQVAEMERLRRKYNCTKPWWPNETAYHNNMISDEEQAAILFQKLLYSWSRGAVGYVWHSLNENRQKDGSLPYDFGLLTPELYPKSAFVTYNMLAAYFSDARYEKSLADNKDGFFAYLFRNAKGDILIPLWKLEKDKVLAAFGNVTGEAVLVDIFGNETPLAVRNGTVAILLKELPCTLVLRNSKTVPVWHGALFSGKTELDKGRFVLKMPLFNPFADKPLDVFCNVSKGDVTPVSAEKHLAPGGRAELQFVIPADRVGKFEFQCELRFGKLWQGVFNDTFILPYTMSGEFPDKPQIELKHQSQWVNLTPMGADYMDEHWKGPNDVSAAFFLRAKERSLQFRIEVTDDIHVPSAAAAELWRYDSIQFGLSLPRQQGFWIIGLADGKTPQVYIWSTPVGYSAAKSSARIRLSVQRDQAARKTVYNCTVPYSAIGLTQAKGKEGFNIDFLVNDNDGRRRESFLRLTPGIGNVAEPALWKKIIVK